MEKMKPEEREKFIAQRINAILKAYEDFKGDIGELTAEERDKFIDNRMIRDTAITEDINRRARRYVMLRKITWAALTFVDALSLLAFIGLALHERHDLFAFSIIGSALVASRIVTFLLLRELQRIVFAREWQSHHQADSAALLSLINLIDQAEKNK